MYKKTESLAWLVLLLSFFVCIALSAGMPLLARWYLNSSTRPLVAMLESREGTIAYQPPSSSTWRVVDKGALVELSPRSQIRLENDGNALLLFYHPDELEVPIGTVQLYGDTRLSVESARTPRFGLSKQPHRVELQLAEAINMRSTLTGNGRDAEFEILTPHGTIGLEEGSFKLVVEDFQTEIKVSAGRATIADPSTGEVVVVVPLQRVSLTTGGMQVAVGERNILKNRNGDFQESIETDGIGYWLVYSDRFDTTENGGSAFQVPLVDGNQIIVFERVGQTHAETGIKQDVNLDLRDVDSLQVRALIRVGTQTLPVCGSVGTECPIMIRIVFVDQATGGNREWLQGFYARDGSDIPFCQTCEWKAQHIKVPVDTWYDYESENLLPLLREQGIDPAAVREIEVYASGWSYTSAIDEIALLVGE